MSPGNISLLDLWCESNTPVDEEFLMRTVVIVGNPKPLSRTRHAAAMLAERLTGAEPDVVVDVADLGPGLLGWGDPSVAAAKEQVKSADLLVVASPTFKATYTGLLKLFLDQFGAGELGGVTTVPLMLGAAPHHALAVELSLKPVLVEIGCSCPTPGLYLLDSAYEDSPELAAWLERAHAVIPTAVTR
ncbi:NAD(P)H-dependent oxidoreductase [Streptomyces sp. NPDC051572]|uniref:NADPH-dependent FMN reductase n=1 Tax=unclassified Streptomyces TaxID=2593676 RepID=UPI003450ED6D